jgi:threonylcarbamoyladenosine tRNA methylthiotransferase MtaB
MKVKFYTLGCKVNQYETQALAEDFRSYGCETTQGKADLYVINTCSVTAKADSKSRELILRAKKENSKAQIAVCGCLAQLNKDYVAKLGVDWIVPQAEKYNLANIILGTDKKTNSTGIIGQSAERSGASPKGTGSTGKTDPTVSTGLTGQTGSTVSSNIWSLKISGFFNQRAFLKIQDGCDNFCSFCKVPHIRGRSISRPYDEVIEEARRLASKHREIVLCGVNLALYGKDLLPRSSLGGLTREILKIPDLGRLRLTSLEPGLVTDGLLSLFRHPKLCPHLHLPFQSGDDRVLNAMNKKETVALYENLVNAARVVDSDIAITCDILIGFPAEGEKEFRNTVEFIKRVKPMRTHIFTFSPREKTAYEKTVVKNRDELKKRFTVLNGLCRNLADEYYKKFIGKELAMVAEETDGGYTCGYTQNYIKVYTKAKVELGKIYPVTIEEIKKEKVFGSISKT